MKNLLIILLVLFVGCNNQTPDPTEVMLKRSKVGKDTIVIGSMTRDIKSVHDIFRYKGNVFLIKVYAAPGFEFTLEKNRYFKIQKKTGWVYMSEKNFEKYFFIQTSHKITVCVSDGHGKYCMDVSIPVKGINIRVRECVEEIK